MEGKKKPSGRVSSEWGWVKVQSNKGVMTFKDAFVYPGGAEEWEWLPATSHEGGMNEKELERIPLDVTHLVLSQGVCKKLQIKGQCKVDAQELFYDKLFIGETPDAVAKFNQWEAEGHRVAAFIHSTC